MESFTSTQDYYSTIFAKTFSPCGNYLVTGSNFGKISVFNIVNALTIDISINSKLPVNVFQAHDGCIYCFESTERYLVSGGSTEIHGFLWKDVISLKDPKPKWTFRPPSSSPFEIPETNGLAIDKTDGGTLFAASGDNKVYAWDLSSGELKLALKGHTDYVHTVSYLPKSKQIVSGGEDGVVKFWDERVGGEGLDQIEPNALQMAARHSLGKWISCIAVDNSEDWLVCGGASHLSLWHLESKTATTVFHTPHSCPQVVRFEDDYLLSAGTEPNVFKWAINGELRSSFPCTPKSVFSLCVSEGSNRLLAISGHSYHVDISTNFDYKAFSLSCKT